MTVVEGLPEPNEGKFGTVYIAGNILSAPNYTVGRFARTYFHELGNLLSAYLSNDYETYGDPNGIGKQPEWDTARN